VGVFVFALCSMTMVLITEKGRLWRREEA
jgi:hypothetical protein